MRAGGYSYNKIRDYLNDKWVLSLVGKRLWIGSIEKIIKKKFYMWVMESGWKEYQWTHKPLVSKELFYKANGIRHKPIHTYKWNKYSFSGLLKCEDWFSFRWYTKKWHIYYVNWAKSTKTINISEKLVLEKSKEVFKEYDFKREDKEINIEMLREIVEKANEREVKDIEKIKREIKLLNKRKNTLVDSFLDWDIDKDIYKTKLEEIELKIIESNKKLQPLSKISDKKLKVIQKWVELVSSLYRSYSDYSMDKKIELLKSLWVELLVDTKKELHIAKSKLLKLFKKIGFHLWYAYGELNPGYRRERAVS